MLWEINPNFSPSASAKAGTAPKWATPREFRISASAHFGLLQLSQHLLNIFVLDQIDLVMVSSTPSTVLGGLQFSSCSYCYLREQLPHTQPLAETCPSGCEPRDCRRLSTNEIVNIQMNLK